MPIRDRIIDFRRVPPRTLRSNPRNWRVHPPGQKAALAGLLAEIGYADALLARSLPDGSLELIDGHLRAETTPETEVPVLVVDLTEAEAAKLLALLDPLAAMAESDRTALDALLDEVETDNEAVAAALDAMRGGEPAVPDAAEVQYPPEIPVHEIFQVVVECRDESEQRALFERLKADGYRCRVMSL